jgi:hypothetical protein
MVPLSSDSDGSYRQPPTCAVLEAAEMKRREGTPWLRGGGVYSNSILLKEDKRP